MNRTRRRTTWSRTFSSASTNMQRPSDCHRCGRARSPWAPAYLGLGEVSLARHDYPAAVSWNERALAQDDTLFAARHRHCAALCPQGRVGEAMACLERGQAQFPLERQAYAELMAALSAMHQPAANPPATHQRR